MQKIKPIDVILWIVLVVVLFLFLGLFWGLVALVLLTVVGLVVTRKREHEEQEMRPNEAIEDEAIEPVDEHLDKAMLYSSQGKFDEAIKECNKAIELDPKCAGFFYYWRGRAYLVKGEDDKAIADLGKAIELDPHCYPAYFARGGIYREKGECDKSIAELEKCIEVSNRSRTPINLVTIQEAQKILDELRKEH